MKGITITERRGSDEFVMQFGKHKVSKISKYGWEVVNKPGEYMMIDKKALRVPVEYQRVTRSNRVLEIAKNWDWMACGALCVMIRNDGEYYVVDGGHRKAAADKRSDIKELPCLVFVGDELGKEAESFLNINTNRSPMTIFERFRAMIEAGDTDVIDCAEMVKQTGHHFAPSGGPEAVRCIAAVLKSFRADREMTDAMWPLCAEVHGGEAIHTAIWSGMWYLYFVCGVELYEKTIRAKLVNAGKIGCLQAINKSKIMLNAGGEKVSAHGLLSVVNWKRSKKIIPKCFMGEGG